MKIKCGTFGRALAAAGLILSLAAGRAAWAQSSVDLHGSAISQYVYRSTDSGTTDQDVYQYLSLDLNNDQSAVSGHFFGRLTDDIDGHQQPKEFYPFASIYDTEDNPLVAHLYYAYLDLNRVPGLKKIRLGRMGLYDTPVPLYLDGGLVETNEWKEAGYLSFGAYAGSPVHFFESDTQSDYSYGAWLQGRPCSGSRLRADYAHVHDPNLYGIENDDFVALSAWQQLGQYVRLHGFYSRLEDDNRDLQLDGLYFNPKQDFMVSASYYQLLEAQTVQTIDFDSFYGAEFTYYPYRQYRLLASKGLGDHFFVEGGADLRALVDNSDRSNFNHDFIRYFGTVGMRDLPEGLTASLTGEVWDSNKQFETIETYGGDVSYRQKRIKLSVGSYYSMFKYDYTLMEEQTRVQTYYARLRYSPVEAVALDAGYEFEEGDLEDFSTMKLGFRYSF